MKTRLLLLVLVFHWAANVPAAFAAESANDSDPFALLKQRAIMGTSEGPAATVQAEKVFPVNLEAGDLEIIRKLYVDDFMSRSKHEQWTLEFISKSWLWHLYSTAFLFLLVLGIVIFGLYITYLQFNRDYKTWTPPLLPVAPTQGEGGQKPVEGGDGTAVVGGQAATPTALNSVKISAGGLELSSQVIGLLVLAISLAFFYLYVMKVYPMQTDEVTQLRANAKSNNKPTGDSVK